MLKTFINYYGGKWRAAPRYPKPQFNTIIEPFAGGAGYSLRYADRDVILYEKDSDLVAMWQWLIQAEPDDVLALPLIGEFNHLDEVDAPHGAKVLIGFCLNAGAAGPRKTPCSWARGDASPANFWGIARRSRVAEQVRSVKHWRCEQVECFTEIPDVEATWFVDPPYQSMGKYYRHSSAQIDFNALGDWCRSRSGQVIACENEGADWLDWNGSLQIKGCSGRHRTGKSNEVYWHRPAEVVVD